MNESKSFQDVVKRVLVPEEKQEKKIPTPKKKKKSNYVSEAIGGGNTSSPTTMSVQNTAGGGSQGMPPFSRANTTDNGTASIDMRDIGKGEEEAAKDHSNKPYPLNNLVDLLANSGEKLQDAQSLIKLCTKKNNVTITDSQKKVLKAAEQAINSSLGNIAKAAKAVETIKL